MFRLSSSIANIKAHYDVVVAGSGYGGSIAASRLARAGRTVCLLERGKEFQPGEYPDTALEVVQEFQTDLPAGHIGPKTGLFDMRVNHDISVFQGCGLGGTSLINANVSMRADSRVFLDPAWPAAIREHPDVLDQAYALAESMLRPSPYPETFPSLQKFAAHARSAARLGASVTRPPINVTFQSGINHVGVEQKACNLCGDCVTGCNHRAKNTTLMNYLPDARNHGAEIFTHASVRYVERVGDRWVVHYQLLDSGRESFSQDTLIVSGDIVILSAGSLGSTEILLRSREHGLPLSHRLGHNFTGNGDVLGFAYNCDCPICGVGWGELTEELSDAKVGPCITGMIDLRAQSGLEDGMVIEEGSIPGAIRGILSGTMVAASALLGRGTDGDLVNAVLKHTREGVGLVTGPYTGAMRNTQTFLVMSHDGSRGEMRLENDRLRIHWPGVGKAPICERIAANLEAAAAALGGTFVKNPMWTDMTDQALITVHPLGGCAMADTAERGVVNHKGEVFSGPTGESVHEGLFVCDGAVMPRSLGVNPLLTISALAERSISLLALDRGWTIDYGCGAPQPVRGDELKPGIQFTETMKGFFARGARSFEEGWDEGRRQDSTLGFILTVSTDDAYAMLEDPQHRGRMVGTVTAPALSDAPLVATDGVFRLFVANPAQPGVRNMVYTMTLTSESGARYRFSGYKMIREDEGLDLWSDTTTLYVIVYAEEGDREVEVGKGILRIRQLDFLKQMNSFKAINCRSMGERLAVIAGFGKFFGGALYETYGSIFAKRNVFSPDAAPRKRRSLMLPAPEVVFFKGDDQATLCLTRYRGGRKGPVLMMPGMGTSTLPFVLDTVDVSLGEFLCANGYDVWLFDCRVSPALRACDVPCSLDEIARWDVPAAIARVKALTDARTIQVVAHCLGAAALQMSVMGGHLAGDVRSAVLSQFGALLGGADPLSATARHPPSILTTLGADVVADALGSEWINHLSERLRASYPRSYADRECDSPACRRIRLLWGEEFEHGRLNHATHTAIHEMFGHASLSLLQHLSSILRRQQIIDRAGADVYVPNLHRLNFPIAFVQSDRNLLFPAVGTARTVAALCERNDPALYSVTVLPGYGHTDWLIGKDAAHDVFPDLLRELDKHN